VAKLSFGDPQIVSLKWKC